MSSSTEATVFPGKDTHWTTDVRVPMQFPLGEGAAGYAPKTVMQVLAECVEKNGSRDAVYYLKPGQDTYSKITWSEYAALIRKTAKALIGAGVQRFDGVSILGFNSLEWFLSNNGAIFAGAIAAGIYTTNNPEACAYVAEHSDSSVVLVENESQLKKFSSFGSDRLTKVKAYVCWAEGFATQRPENRPPVYNWTDFMALGDAVEDAVLEERIKDQQTGHCCTLIYTSGTMSFPKAVMISHDNCTWTARVAIESLKVVETDRMISYLPLSHIAAQMLDVHGPMSVGYSVWFAKPDALRGSLPHTLQTVKPTVFLGVPRVWEKIMEAMKAAGRQTTGMKKKIAEWARGKGLEGGFAEQSGKSKPWGYGIARRLVFDKVRAKLGFDECRLCATSAAPIGRETLEFFLSLGIPILEIYGMSECSGPETISLPDRYATGSVGFAMPGTELVLDKPDEQGQGELIFKGRHRFLGYLKNDQATSESVDENGYLHSGDLGMYKDKERGLIMISGRAKELIITSGGENIPPVLIEDTVKEETPIISNIMVIGERRKFLSAVVTLRSKPDENGVPTKDLSASVIEILSAAGSKSTTTTDAAKDPIVIGIIQKGIDKANARAISSAQKIQKFRVLEADFTIDGGELTPTMKLKRRIVNEKYGSVIEEMYAETEEASASKTEKKQESSKESSAATPAAVPATAAAPSAPAPVVAAAPAAAETSSAPVPAEAPAESAKSEAAAPVPAEEAKPESATSEAAPAVAAAAAVAPAEPAKEETKEESAPVATAPAAAAVESPQQESSSTEVAAPAAAPTSVSDVSSEPLPAVQSEPEPQPETDSASVSHPSSEASAPVASGAEESATIAEGNAAGGEGKKKKKRNKKKNANANAGAAVEEQDAVDDE
eukprot:ANDGO_01758.mRNA.1 Very long-chain-fatty-acid--CoA ligase bubblegum